MLPGVSMKASARMIEAPCRHVRLCLCACVMCTCGTCVCPRKGWACAQADTVQQAGEGPQKPSPVKPEPSEVSQPPAAAAASSAAPDVDSEDPIYRAMMAAAAANCEVNTGQGPCDEHGCCPNTNQPPCNFLASCNLNDKRLQVVHLTDGIKGLLKARRHTQPYTQGLHFEAGMR
eukprot:1141384-Pelagomonas_calceolata.AAC.2